MTPFGARLRALRAERGITLKRMAADLQFSPAYLSALEHGRRGKPSRMLVMQVCAYFNIIWDDADSLQQTALLSDPKVKIDTSGLSPKSTELANRLARRIRKLSPATVDRLLALLDEPGR